MDLTIYFKCQINKQRVHCYDRNLIPCHLLDYIYFSTLDPNLPTTWAPPGFLASFNELPVLKATPHYLPRPEHAHLSRLLAFLVFSFCLQHHTLPPSLSIQSLSSL